MSNQKITINIKGEKVELSVSEAKKLMSELKKQEAEVEKKKESAKYKKIASGSFEEIVKYCEQKTREAEIMDYETNGGVSYDVIELFSYLPSDVLREFGKKKMINGEYLSAANKVLESRGEKPISKKSKM